jgi:hypothetical protein
MGSGGKAAAEIMESAMRSTKRWRGTDLPWLSHACRGAQIEGNRDGAVVRTVLWMLRRRQERPWLVGGDSG